MPAIANEDVGEQGMEDDNDDNDEQQQEEPAPTLSHQEYDAASVEAGVVRGVSRSVAQRTAAVATQRAGRSMAKLPSVGKLPRASVPRHVKAPPTAVSRVRLPKPGASAARPVQVAVPKPKAGIPRPKAGSMPKRANIPKPTTATPRRVPVKQVAQVTDRMSTGLEIWESAASSSSSSSTSSGDTSAREEPSSSKDKSGTTRQQQTASAAANDSKWSQRLSRTGSFAVSLIKNTLLGAIVFETYCSVVAQAAEHNSSMSWSTLSSSLSWVPLSIQNKHVEDVVANDDEHDTASSNPEVLTINGENHGSTTDDSPRDHFQQEEQNEDPIISMPAHATAPLDVFEKTPVVVHFVAGAIAGGLQGLAGRVWEIGADSLASTRSQLLLRDNVAASTSIGWIVPRPASGWNVVTHSNMGQHAVAHSLLFGSYEGLKRGLLWSLGHSQPPGSYSSSLALNEQVEDYHEQQQLQLQQRVEYLAAVGLAGGLAGQLQHMASYVLEHRQLQLLESQPPRRWVVSWPSLRSTVWAFPGSAIAFLAFEYGKDYVADLQ